MNTIRNLEESAAYGVYFAGDASGEAKARLRTILSGKDAPRPLRGHPEAAEQARKANLDWEPFEVLQQLIDDSNIRTVGGVPQMLKIYQYGLTETFVWRTDSGDYFGGREVKHGERFDRRIARFVNGEVTLQHSDRSIASAAEGLSDSDEEV